jgi:hydroxypyruvate isomerase
MKRRNFIQAGLTAAASAWAISPTIAKEREHALAGKPFKMNYAPHDGMFKNHGGTDFVDQIKFMADQGFRGIEDNGLLGRPVAEQERIGKTLAQLGMTMGVFVIDGGDNVVGIFHATFWWTSPLLLFFFFFWG